MTITIFFDLLRNGWTFNELIYLNLYWSLYYSSILVSILCLIALKARNFRGAALIIGLLMSIPIFWMTFNPIDRYDYPKDVRVIEQNSAYKIVVRQATSGKTNQERIDTVKVIDHFIFRKIVLEE